MNYFAYRSAAQRYLKGRPYFHPKIISRISTYLSLDKSVACAIDVGCGTGLSTVALRALAERVVGVDIAEEMIVLAPPGPNISYVVSPAEQLPFRSDSIDLITVSQAFHWISRNDFLAEAHRVLHRDAWLIVYDNYFSGQMKENEKFESWVKDGYNQEYPSPPRASINFRNEDAEEEGFQFANQEIYSNSTTFSLEELISYLMTHSNIIAAVEGGNKNAVDVQNWLRESITPFFDNNTTEVTIKFNAPIWYLRKVV